jgi:hypothetical protein
MNTGMRGSDVVGRRRDEALLRGQPRGKGEARSKPAVEVMRGTRFFRRCQLDDVFAGALRWKPWA